MDPQRGRAGEQVGGHRTLGQHDRDDPAEAGVADLGDRGVLAQPGGELGGVGLGTLDAQVQGAQATHGQPRLEGAGDRADQVAPVLQDPVELVVAGDDRAQQGVAVAGEVLGRGVDHHVGPELQRPLQQRGGEGVVDHDVGPGLVRRGDDPVEVGDLERRVGGGLHPHQRRVDARREHGVGVGDVDQRDREPATRLEVGQLHHAALVGVPGRDDLGALADEVEHGGDGGEAGREGERAAALERAERVLERAPGRVAVAAVLQVAARDVRRGHRQRHVERLVGLVRGTPGGHRQRGRLQGRVVAHTRNPRPLGSCR